MCADITTTLASADKNIESASSASTDLKTFADEPD